MKDYLTSILHEERAEELADICTLKTISASHYFIRAGDIPLKVAFIQSGLFRYVYINDNGDEFTKGLISEHHFICSYSAMINKQPSYFFIEAMEDAHIMEFHWSAYQQLLEKDSFWVHFLLKFIEKGFIKKEQRERDFLLLNASARYNNFLEEYPGIDQRISQGIIASYLGIKPETLSRIRRKITS